MRKKSLLLIAIEIMAVLLAGCGYQLINPEQKTVYVGYFSNHTLQPGIDLFLVRNLKKTLAEAPGFMVVSKTKDAHLIINGKIQQFVRTPEFIAESDQIIMASYRVSVLVEIDRDGKTVGQKLDQTYVLELSRGLRTDQLLDILSKKIAQDIYFRLIKADER